MRRRRLLPVLVVSHCYFGCARQTPRERLQTNHCAGNTKTLQLLAIVCARLGAVIRHEDHLFACARGQHLASDDYETRTAIRVPFLRSSSRVSTVPGKQ